MARKSVSQRIAETHSDISSTRAQIAAARLSGNLDRVDLLCECLDALRLELASLEQMTSTVPVDFSVA